MRLYRGLKGTYRSDLRPNALEGVTFADCPYTAALHAVGRRGQVLVLHIPDDVVEVRVRKELWLNAKAERLMVLGRFDDYIVGILPAKELRRRVGAKGHFADLGDCRGGITALAPLADRTASHSRGTISFKRPSRCGFVARPQDSRSGVYFIHYRGEIH